MKKKTEEVESMIIENLLTDRDDLPKGEIGYMVSLYYFTECGWRPLGRVRMLEVGPAQEVVTTFKGLAAVLKGAGLTANNGTVKILVQGYLATRVPVQTNLPDEPS